MFVLLHVCLAAMWLPGEAQPTACLDEDHCPTGFYCNRDVHHCHECLHCATFKRQEPSVPTPCVKSIVRCGPCFKGLEEPVDVNSACVPLVERVAESVTPGYVWVFVGLGVPVLVLLTAVVVWWALRNTETFKVIASTRTSVRPARPVEPSAPEQPPPYSEQYMPVRATSPGLPLYETNVEGNESEYPFIKPLPQEQLDQNRETEANQAANWYNNPNYVRLPPSHPSAQPAQESARDVTPERFTVHDEDTMESVWTPGTSSRDNDNDTNNNSSEEASSGPVEVAPRRTRPLDLTTQVPAKVLCVRRPSPPGSPSTSRRPRPAPAVTQNIVINVTQNNFDADLATTHLH